MQSVALALEHFRRGGIVLIWERTGGSYLALSAELARPDELAFVQNHGSGPSFLALVTIEQARRERGTLPSCETTVARAGGVLEHAGFAEAAVDLARLSRLKPLALMREFRRHDVTAFADQQDLPTVTVAALIHHRQRNEAMLDLIAVADLPTPHADRPFRVYSFRSSVDDLEHLALVASGKNEGEPLVRIHSECLTGDAFGSLRCDCGPQLDESLRRLGASAGGILVYMRGHEGRGIGLANKMRAYALQDNGLDTVEANRALGLPEDARDFGHAAQILLSLGHSRVRLLTNNPEKAASLERHGIQVVGIEPLIIPPNPFNANYLDTKATKFGHALPTRFAK